MVNLKASETASAGSPPFWSRCAGWVRENPLPCALAIQAALSFYRLDLLEPWGDEWFTLTTVARPLSEIRPIVEAAAHPPLYFFLLHFWIQIPWPADPLVKMRAMSVLWTLLATMILDRLWLSGLEPRLRRRLLALWVLSPCLLLYSRMARSYSMQLALALLTIYAATKWLARPRSLRWLLAYSCSWLALLFTHYLPGLAIMAAVWVILVTKQSLSVKMRLTLLASPVLIVVLLYLPSDISILQAIGTWSAGSTYRVGNLFIDQIVRVAYWFVSLSFGETISAIGIVLGTALTPAVALALFRGMRSRPGWMGLVATASIVAYIGVSRWTGYPFTPARVLFALPFFLILVGKGINSSPRGYLLFAGLLIVYISSDYSYFAKIGYLNKAYCVPYREMAALIDNESPPRGSVLLVDGYSSDADPLLNRLGNNVHVISLDNEQSAERDVAPLQHEQGTIWFWRHTHDISPNQFVSRLETELARDRRVTQYHYLPYSMPERWILTLLRGPGQPAYFYRLSEMRSQ